MLPGLKLTLLTPGGQVLHLTGEAENLRWSTMAVGGFGSCSFSLPSRRRLPYLGLVRVTFGELVLFEGLLEDPDYQDGALTWTAYGLRRRLEQVSVQRVWSLRTIAWDQAVAAAGGGWTATTGQFDISNLTRWGVSFAADGVNRGTLTVAGTRMPAGVTLISILAYLTTTALPTTESAFVDDTTDEVTWNRKNTTAGTGGTASTALNIAATTNARRFRFGADAQGNISVGSAAFENVRVLCTTVTEDVAGTNTGGGFYGGSILRDLISLVPELTPGVIETGSDFTIEQLERTVRSSALSVVEEVAGYYTRQWGVWDSDTPGVGRFDWKTRNLDEPNWLTGVSQFAGIHLVGTTDNLIRTIRLSYVDATLVQAAEVSATSTDRRNPYVRRGMTKDATAQVSFLMTANSAQQLANKLVNDQGGFPTVTGTLKLPFQQLVDNAFGGSQPAYTIRGGDTILITDLPKTEPLRQGRDGETLFMVAAAETDEQTGLVTLEVDGFMRRSDVLLARLAAVTRTVAG